MERHQRDRVKPSGGGSHAPGALVISLDFELHWGLRDHTSVEGPYRRNFLGVRRAVPGILSAFREFDIAATWATVGFLFAATRAQLEEFCPRSRPSYADARLSPYSQPTGADEREDPFHFAPSLIDSICATARQEIGTHTFSHYYCLEPGQTREEFASDLASAVAIASTRGVQLRSIVFPRNQHNPDYDCVIRDAGITCYRGNASGWMHRASSEEDATVFHRTLRFVDSTINFSGSQLTEWSEIRPRDGLSNVPASFFLRPTSGRLRDAEPLRLRRITKPLREAAERGRVLHMWWHPHNFGADVEANLDFLKRLLETFADLRHRYGFLSLSMSEAADYASRVL